MHGEWRCLTCGRSGGNGTAPFYSGPCLGDGIPLVLEHKEEPLITDDQLVEMTLKNSMITREQVQRNEDLQPMYNARYLGGYDVRAIYEAQRTKDRALIQTLMDKADSVIKRWDSPKWKWDQHTGELIRELQVALDAAKEQGFTPTER